MNGNETETSCSKIQQAAEQGNTDAQAQYRLGMMYATGRGVEQL